NAEKIALDAKAYEISIEGATVVDPENFEKMDEYATKLAEIRAKKGMTFEQAKAKLMSDKDFLGAMLVKMGDAEGMVSGATAPTANVLRAGIQVIGTRPGVKTVSSVFVMELTQKKDLFGSILLFGDCSVIPRPTSEQLADIATSAAETAITIAGINPRVALMTFSTKGSANHECVDLVKDAGKLLRERKVSFRFDDELQADAALVKSIGEVKAPLSDVSGNANVLIFPTLSAGNIGYKLVQRLAGANAYGPIIQGLNAPINDLSRGCSADDITVLVAITSAQACTTCTIAQD
ncbi:MAG: phosphate acetyltransferase, partial [Fusobacterium sp.]